MGYHPTDPAAGMIGVASIARDDVDVAVHHSLTGSMAYVEPDIVAVRCILFIDEFFTLVEQFEEGTSFIVCQIETILHMAKRDHEHVAS